MERDDECPFSKLPSPIITDILIKLPTENIVGCRCVCKSWLKLLSETEFVNMHLQRSLSQTRLIINNLSFESQESFLFNLVKVKDHVVQQLPLQDEQNYDLLQYVPGSKMEFPKYGYNVKMVGSVKGLVCLNEFPLLHIWNPTMKQTITIPNPNNETRTSNPNPNPNTVIIRYGFGTTLVSGKYKVVKVSQELDILKNDQYDKLFIKNTDCQVYTLGEGSWRSIENVPFRYYNNHRPTDEHGLYLNGKIYWLTDDLDHGSEFISCLDLEKEVFLQPLPSPPGLIIKDHKATLNLYKGCLSVCDNMNDSEIVIWVMKEYETDKKSSWIKQVVVPKISVFFGCPRHIDVVRIIKVFKDGTMLLIMRNYVVFSYHPKNNSLTSFDGRDLIGAIKKRTCMFEELYPSLQAMDYVSTILSLKNFGMEKVNFL